MNIKEKLLNYIRILKITKKPSKQDFSDTARICAIGVAVIGLIGFALYLLTLLFNV